MSFDGSNGFSGDLTDFDPTEIDVIGDIAISDQGVLIRDSNGVSSIPNDVGFLERKLNGDFSYKDLGNVDNTSDANKPISTATGVALEGKANLVGGNIYRGGMQEIRSGDDLIPAAGTQGGKLALVNNPGPSAYGMLFGVLSTGKGFIQQQRLAGNTNVFDLLLQPNGGNVGIGTTNPGVKFDVAGVGRFSDNLIGNNGIYAQGAASGTMGSNACSIKYQNTSSGAIWASRVDNANNLVFEYFNGATWVLVKTLTPAGAWS